MFRLTVAALIFLLIDWIAFDGDLIVLWLVDKIEAGASLGASLVISTFG